MKLLAYIVVMALTTYLIRMLPLVIFKNKIKSNYIQSFLYYVPYAVLGAMTFPAILYSTSNMYSAFCGMIVAIYLAYKEKDLLIVAILACLSVFVCELII